jgi:hypothetical protein
MPTLGKIGRPYWISIWFLAISVTLIDGNWWRHPTSMPPSWKVDIQLPGMFVVLYAGWFMGPLQVSMSPLSCAP